MNKRKEKRQYYRSALSISKKNAKELRHNLEQVQQQIEQLEENQQTLIQKISQKNGQYQQIEKQLTPTTARIGKISKISQRMVGRIT